MWLGRTQGGLLRIWCRLWGLCGCVSLVRMDRGGLDEINDKVYDLFECWALGTW